MTKWISSDSTCLKVFPTVVPLELEKIIDPGSNQYMIFKIFAYSHQCILFVDVLALRQYTTTETFR
jgi:hypothetical protein